MTTHYQVAILDNGSKYVSHLDQKVRALNIETKILPLGISAKELSQAGYGAIIISAGADESEAAFDSNVLLLRVPVLGIDYGMDLINMKFGGTLQADILDHEQQYIHVEPASPLFNGLGPLQSVNSPRSSILQVGKSMEVIGTSSNASIAAIQNEGLRIYGVQFHPEAEITQNGDKMLSNFLFHICGLSPKYTVHYRLKSSIKHLARRIMDNKVLLFVSGGLISVVCIALLAKAVAPEQIIVLHIDNGLLRHFESDNLERWLKVLGVDLLYRKEEKYFLGGTISVKRPNQKSLTETEALSRVFDPEEKRSIVEERFNKLTAKIFQELSAKHKRLIVAVSSLRSDILKKIYKLTNDIEADTYKFNDALLSNPLIANSSIKPLQEFYKEDMRELAALLGVPSEFINKFPLPSGGLSVRVLCAPFPVIQEGYAETHMVVRILLDYENRLQNDNALVERISKMITDVEERRLMLISASKLHATILPVRASSTRNNKMTYSYALGLSCPGIPNWSDLLFIAQLLPKFVNEVSRVCFIFGPPVQNMFSELTPTTLDAYALMQIRLADAAAHRIIKRAELHKHITDMPIILLPVYFDSQLADRRRAIVLRPYLQSGYNSGMPATPGNDIPTNVIDKLVEALTQINGIGRVLYDLTFNPPGLVEWE